MLTGSELAARALVEVSEMPRGLRLRFSGQADTERELRELIEAESRCCPFLDLALRRSEGWLILDVSGPDEAAPVVRALFGLPAVATAGPATVRARGTRA